MMKRHGLRRIFSLLLAVIMVCALLPTATFAADTTEANLIVGGGEPPREPGPAGAEAGRNSSR
ncbi:MAG: hypothetical protein EGQ29_01910 [Clostridiales bacterium]|mgnify:CR=1 FL=1|nr:hypothetical protein [Clostridiales bacterium]MBD9203328.1 hypothetical protein [Clostridiales bacterium]